MTSAQNLDPEEKDRGVGYSLTAETLLKINVVINIAVFMINLFNIMGC